MEFWWCWSSIEAVVRALFRTSSRGNRYRRNYQKVLSLPRQACRDLDLRAWQSELKGGQGQGVASCCGKGDKRVPRASRCMAGAVLNCAGRDKDFVLDM